jgi:murein L,D-transpeptidase YafK
MARPAHAIGWRGAGALLVCGVAAVAVSGCGVLAFRSASQSASPAVAPRDDDDHLAWAEGEPYAVVVRKSCRSLDVYRFGERVRSFAAVFGLSATGSKLYEGDLRTPSGLYAIIDKRPHPRWHHFLLLDYPNVHDLHRYWLAMEAGAIPRRGDGYAGIGGAIGIHGTDRPEMNVRQRDWTWGCISLANGDIDELARLVPIGTLVLIED